MRFIGIAASAKDSAIVTLERTRTEAVCTAIERHGGDLEGLVSRIRDLAESLRVPSGAPSPVRVLDDASARQAVLQRHHVGSSTVRDLIVIDAGAGMGGAIWTALESPKRPFVAQTLQGRARQKIVDSLIAAIALQRLTFAKTDEAPAMRASLGRFRRELDDSGLIGDSLVSALAVALHQPMPVVPRVY